MPPGRTFQSQFQGAGREIEVVAYYQEIVDRRIIPLEELSYDLPREIHESEGFCENDGLPSVGTFCFFEFFEKMLLQRYSDRFCNEIDNAETDIMPRSRVPFSGISKT